MGALVFQYVGQIGISDICGNINFRTDKAEYEGGSEGIGFIDIAVHAGRGLKLAFDFHIRNHTIH